jgi:predicted RecA/RadA family phage recombinase
VKNFIIPGIVLDYTAGANIAAGTLIMTGTFAAVAMADIASGKTGSVRTEGVFELPKASATTATQFAKAYVDGSGLLTSVASGNTLVGIFTAAAVNGETTCRVKINAA